jgi:aminopeptidase N
MNVLIAHRLSFVPRPPTSFPQFPEDSGPMAHPIRPERYMAIDNFYTATVYEKGAEVMGMLQAVLGRAHFNFMR